MQRRGFVILLLPSIAMFECTEIGRGSQESSRIEATNVSGDELCSGAIGGTAEGQITKQAEQRRGGMAASARGEE